MKNNFETISITKNEHCSFKNVIVFNGDKEFIQQVVKIAKRYRVKPSNAYLDEHLVNECQNNLSVVLNFDNTEQQFSLERNSFWYTSGSLPRLEESFQYTIVQKGKSRFSEQELDTIMGQFIVKKIIEIL